MSRFEMFSRQARFLAALIIFAGGTARAAEWSDWKSAHFADHRLAGTVWSGTGEMVSPGVLKSRAAASRFVLLGEIHNNPDHHRLQADLLAAMISAGRKPALVFEMIPADAQPRIDAFVAGSPETAADFGPAVGWAERGWPDWATYQPIADAALAAGLPIVAGDLERDLIRRINRQGRTVLSPQRRKALSLLDDLPEPLAGTLRDILNRSHCNLLPAPAIEPMLLVQRARDGAMAAAMREAARSGADGAVLITGAGHARLDFAVPRILRMAEPASSVLSVAFVEVDPDGLTLDEYEVAGLYDFVVFTPRADLTDQCAELERRMRDRPAPDAG